MNKAITDGVNLMPPAFGNGLDVWSNQDGIPGSSTYDGAANATLVAADADFGTCLELQKTDVTQKLRYMGEIPILAGCYLQVKVRVKAISGPLPSVRIAGWAGGAGGVHIAGVDELGASTALTTYGQIETVTAIIGSGARTGVDMVWGRTPIYGHFGLDLTGPDGGIIRIENIEIKDLTSVFHRKMMDIVDVRDYGAIGDGIADDTLAFEAADAAANGRTILVPEGIFHLSQPVTLSAHVRFEGTVVMPDTARLTLKQDFDYATYVDAFGNEVLALKKALQVLLNYSDHDSLDLNGRIIELSEPLDVHAAVGNRDSFASRRVLRNGQLNAADSAAWTPDVVTATAGYSTTDSRKLTGVSNIAAIQVGSLVQGNGVGREIYVDSKDEAAGTLMLSNPLFGAAPSQSYTFTRFKYLLDFSGFTLIQRFNIEDVEFLCNNRSSGLMIPREGVIFQVRDCWFTQPADRGITSTGRGDSGMQLDGNQFISSETAIAPESRKTIAFNTHGNDVKVRDNRALYFRHFGVMAGGGHIVANNHFFQGHSSDQQRTAGLVFCQINNKTTLSGNYVDNGWIEVGNEYDPEPDAPSAFSFGGFSINGNNFTAVSTQSWFSFIKLKPYGTGLSIDGISVVGNNFKIFGGGTIDRVEQVDTSVADIDHTQTRNLSFHSNTFTRVNNMSQTPVSISHAQPSVSNSWSENIGNYLPFGGQALTVSSVVSEGMITNGSGTPVYTVPYALPRQGVNFDEIKLNWSEAVKGKVIATVRSDLPV